MMMHYTGRQQTAIYPSARGHGQGVDAWRVIIIMYWVIICWTWSNCIDWQLDLPLNAKGYYLCCVSWMLMATFFCYGSIRWNSACKIDNLLSQQSSPPKKGTNWKLTQLISIAGEYFNSAKWVTWLRNLSSWVSHEEEGVWPNYDSHVLLRLGLMNNGWVMGLAENTSCHHGRLCSPASLVSRFLLHSRLGGTHQHGRPQKANDKYKMTVMTESI